MRGRAARCSWRPFHNPRRPAHGEPTHWHTSAKPFDAAQRAVLSSELRARGFAIIDNVIPQDEAQASRLEFRTLFSKFGKADDSDTHEAGIRSDLCQKLGEHEARALGLPALSRAIRTLKAIGHELAEAFFHGDDGALTVAPSVQLAIFPGRGTSYQRHGDNLYDPSQPSSVVAPNGFHNWRVFTVILYVNRGWVVEDGGCLRIYGRCSATQRPLPTSTLREEASYVDVEPLAGRVVCFNSLLHHEVRPVDGLRCALTLWVWKEDGNTEKCDRS